MTHVVTGSHAPGAAAKAVARCASESSAPYRQVVSNDALEHAELFNGWDHVYRQLVPGKFVGNVQEATINGTHLQRERINDSAEQSGAVPRDMITFIAFAPKFDRCYVDGVRLSSDLLFVGGGSELHAVARGGMDAIILSLPTQIVVDNFGPGLDDLINAADARRRIWRPQARHLMNLRRTVNEMLDHMGQSPDLIDSGSIKASLFDEIIGNLAQVLPGGADDPEQFPKSTTRSYIVEWARKYIRERIDESITIGQICAAGRISRRTLQYSFEDVLGISPARYLLALRLNGLRRDLFLSRGEVLLQNAAAQWGFWHMGRLSGQYRQFFGELPSVTLKHAAGRAARSGLSPVRATFRQS